MLFNACHTRSESMESVTLCHCDVMVSAGCLLSGSESSFYDWFISGLCKLSRLSSCWLFPGVFLNFEVIMNQNGCYNTPS